MLSSSGDELLRPPFKGERAGGPAASGRLPWDLAQLWNLTGMSQAAPATAELSTGQGPLTSSLEAIFVPEIPIQPFFLSLSFHRCHCVKHFPTYSSSRSSFFFIEKDLSLINLLDS